MSQLPVPERARDGQPGPARKSQAPLVAAPAKRLSILFCTWNYFPAAAGGAERQARLQAEALVARGHRVTVICPRQSKLPSGEIGGVSVVRLPRIARRHLRRISYFLSIATYLSLKVRQFDLIHIHLTNLQADVIVPIAKLFRRPVYAKVACGGPAGEVARLSRVAGVTRWVGLRNADRVQALSAEIVTELEEIGVHPTRILRLDNGVDLGGFAPANKEEKTAARSALGLPEEALVILYAGRFSRYKGVLELAEVWPAVRAPGSLLVLVGAGPTEEAVAIPPLDAAVIRDFTPGVLPYLHAADVFVYPSHADGMSNAVLEAMACGLAIVASRAGATAEALADGESALLFNPHDMEGLSAALVRVQHDAELRARLGRGAAQAASRFSIDDVVDSLERVYGELTVRQ